MPGHGTSRLRSDTMKPRSRRGNRMLGYGGTIGSDDPPQGGEGGGAASPRALA